MITKIFNQLTTTNSTKDKQTILEANKSNAQLKQLLLYNLNPYFNFYVKKMPERLVYVPDTSWSDGDRFNCFIDMLNDLKGRYTTGNEAKKTIQTVFRMFDDEHYELYSKILLKASIGIGASTVNKVWPDLIPSFKVMLAASQLPNVTDLQYPLYIQHKYDGFRCVYYNDKLYTRSGLPFPNINLQTHFSKLFGTSENVLDGELYMHGKPFNEMSKILNNETIVIPTDMKFYVYDCIPIKDWENQKCNITYTDRLKLLRTVIANIADRKRIIDAPTDKVNSAAEAIEIHKEHLKAGYEGSVLKAVEGKYQWKRVSIKSGEMIKLKPFKDEDLEIVDIVEGEGKYEGSLGSIVVRGNNVANTSVGSGFTDADRKEIWGNKNKYLGRTAQIKYFEISEDKVLRFPIFERIRTDK
mgnify:CR=1 FL=1